MQVVPSSPRPRKRVITRRSTALRGWIGLALAASLLVGTSSCTTSANQHVTAMPESTDNTATSMVSSVPLETATTTQQIPVYWLGKSNSAVYLYREFLPGKGTDDPIVAALAAMMGQKPKDPDYFTAWSKPARLGASISAKNVITVDVSADAFSQHLDEGIAERSIAQLVYTATAAAAMAGLVDSRSPIQVSVLVDGHTAYNAFGHVPLDKPLTRNPAFLAPVWVIDPEYGASYKKLPLQVFGQGISTTGVLQWSLSTVRNGTVDSLYASGTVDISAGPGVLGQFNFNIAPTTGRYELAVYYTDPTQPGVRLGVDTKSISITDAAGNIELK